MNENEQRAISNELQDHVSAMFENHDPKLVAEAIHNELITVLTLIILDSEQPVEALLQLWEQLHKDTVVAIPGRYETINSALKRQQQLVEAE